MIIIQINVIYLFLMIKKYSSILMMFTALAILLGHNLIPHHHHDFDHSTLEHHRHSEDHHHGNEGEGDSENEETDFGDLFSNFQHGGNGITFLSSHHINNLILKQLSPSVAVLNEFFIFQNIVELAKQNSPPYKDVHRNSQYPLPTGLRAPPSFIV